MIKVPELFGENVFNREVMQSRLPREIYRSVMKTVETGESLDPKVAEVVANAMKDWATEKGVTHFTHWFQPMTGVTAEKHDSFISPTREGGVIMEFSGKELIRSEADASSFPSGGIRTTFEARGYTAWDPTSYAFIKDNTLCIPTAYCGYNGEALDKKTPLLRSMRAVGEQALRILRLFGNDAKAVIPTVGAEQEYFLVDKNTFTKRKDLFYTGRTLFGAMPPKGQELDDHYFGTIKTRVSKFMKDLDEELWKLGILAKTEHNEAAPAQHELAPIFATTNVATDHNQLIMEMMKKVARRHDMVCLLHEKPFQGVSGSGKHVNWSLQTDSGVNLLEPGSSPYENAQFLLFLLAFIKAVDEYQDLLRMCVASAGNDCRLGGHEAPPAIISIFLGDELTEILESLESDHDYLAPEKRYLELGIDTLPHFKRDTTDRNRTSPLAFTGNKFEFRMVGSSFSIAGPNFMLNTIVADELKEFADELEKASDFQKTLNALVKRTIKNHKRIIFNGNNYAEEWRVEAEKRGLLNLHNTPEALPHYVAEKNVALFSRHKVLSRVEMMSRMEIKLDSYLKTMNIEALTMVEMAKRDIYPAVNRYVSELLALSNARAEWNSAECESGELKLAKKLSILASKIWSGAEEIERLLKKAALTPKGERAEIFGSELVTLMSALRAVSDEAETLTARDLWPFPTYGEILFSVM